MTAVSGRPGTPLEPVDGAELAMLVGPLVPDRDLVVVQIGDVRITPEEPQELVDNGTQMQFLGGYQWEARRQVEAHLITKHAERAGPGAILLAHPVIAHVAHQVEILLHDLPCLQK